MTRKKESHCPWARLILSYFFPVSGEIDVSSISSTQGLQSRSPAFCSLRVQARGSEETSRGDSRICMTLRLNRPQVDEEINTMDRFFLHKWCFIQALTLSQLFSTQGCLLVSFTETPFHSDSLASLQPAAITSTNTAGRTIGNQKELWVYQCESREITKIETSSCLERLSYRLRETLRCSKIRPSVGWEYHKVITFEGSDALIVIQRIQEKPQAISTHRTKDRK